MNKEEVEVRRDQQKKTGKALLKFFNEHELDIEFLMALEDIFKKLASGEDFD